MKDELIKVAAIILIVVLILTFFLAIAGKATWRLFWFVAILDGVIAYYVLPWIKKEKPL